MKSIQKTLILIAVIGLMMPTSAVAQNIFPKGELAPNVPLLPRDCIAWSGLISTRAIASRG
ncbi:hypothetical protein [Christiangramia sp.]|uniref:hypothetical protein n=1 Tax=Christiangramia sp. TaxID=1931228 RepID=UPI00261FC2F4|nr:hypothetical protein [Christiangramia sp.]